MERSGAENKKENQTCLRYALVASLRPNGIRPLVRVERLPGEFRQHDFGQVDVHFRQGSSSRIRFFASRLTYSRYIRVSAAKVATVESLVRRGGIVSRQFSQLSWFLLFHSYNLQFPPFMADSQQSHASQQFRRSLLWTSKVLKKSNTSNKPGFPFEFSSDPINER